MDLNPGSHIISAVRSLANEGAISADVGWALLGCGLIIAVLAPLSVAAYTRKM